MSFTVVCDKCQAEYSFSSSNSKKSNFIEIDVTEDCDVLGCVVESIDVYCSNCDNIISI